ncbi:fimbrial assembly protein (PilN) family protein [[Synechococcus] sp. NIES-970]|uniref:PilN domain-containing protein n=1 Tax=Picosynechococcus sp. NKBG15041c TaxID=1407650 RepID=UPI00041AA5D8|nr:PilN domain-containing protein [Picosynechococcus sp. NKBG15041c]BAW96447.1 fimbrial assembly protein (PilN) family protein [[Synechococcus] sp. NIES-970]
MYGLDINFLKDRGLTKEAPGAIAGRISGKPGTVPGQEPGPLIIGGAVAAVALGVVGFLSLLGNQDKARVQEEIAVIDQQLQGANAQQARLQQIQQEIDTFRGQSQVFVEVLQTRIKPWAAVLREIGDLTPAGLRIASFEQTENQVLVRGTARTFTEVNDFVLNLPESPLLQGEEIYIVNANLVDNPVTAEQVEFPRPVASFSLPQVVEYTVSVSLRDLTDAEVIQTLEAQGARGMAERLRSSF